MVTKDFTKKHDQITFTVGDQTFRAKSPIPARVLMNFAKRFSSMSQSATIEEQMDAFDGVLKLVLKPESYKRFNDLMDGGDEDADEDTGNAIEIAQVEEIITWLMEQYGLRPTEPPSNSVPGPDDLAAGMSSVGNTPAVLVETSSTSL